MKTRYFLLIIAVLLVACGAPAAATTQVPPMATPTLVQPTAAPTASPTTSTVPLVGVMGIEASGGFLWAWNGDEIWRYTGGEWSPYAASPYYEDLLLDVAYLSDTLWAVADSPLRYLEEGGWQELEGQYPGVYLIEADNHTGIMWISTSSGENLHRWNGEEMNDVGHPPSSGIMIGEIGVTGDGIVWAGGMNWFFPDLGGLARYNDATGSWEMVRPWGADEDVPAQELASTPNGGLWVVLADWSEDWEELQAGGEPFVEWVLAHRDGASGEWTVFEEGLPQGLPNVMAADDEAVWLTQGWGPGPVIDEIDGLIRFDGEDWRHYLPGEVVMDVAIAPDGTIWYTTWDDDEEVRLHLLR